MGMRIASRLVSVAYQTHYAVISSRRRHPNSWRVPQLRIDLYKRLYKPTRVLTSCTVRIHLFYLETDLAIDPQVGRMILLCVGMVG